MIKNARSFDDIADFIFTMGDNIYPIIPGEPSDYELDWMLSLFKTPNLAKIPIYAVRGNHDAKFDA